MKKKTTKKKTARKGVRYSRAVCERLLARIAAGETLTDICKDDKMPSYVCFYEWIKKHEWLVKDYARAREKMADTMFEKIEDIANETEAKILANPDLGHVFVSSQKLKIDTIKWRLSKMMPKKYGTFIAQEITGADGGPIKTESELKISQRDEDAIRRIADARKTIKEN